jgi:hypothetical protein
VYLIAISRLRREVLHDELYAVGIVAGNGHHVGSGRAQHDRGEIGREFQVFINLRILSERLPDVVAAPAIWIVKVVHGAVVRAGTTGRPVDLPPSPASSRERSVRAFITIVSARAMEFLTI